MTVHPEMLNEPTSTLLGLLWFTKPGTESYRDIVKELLRRDGNIHETADAWVFRQAYNFRRELEDELPCSVCQPDEYKAKLDSPVDDAAGKEVR